jgi:formamidopyrimidine-DNA glycosylase
MPELPEVEAIARALRPLVARRTIMRCRVLHPIAVREGRESLPRQVARIRNVLRERKIEAVERRGKYLLLKLDKGYVAMHFKFDGHLVWFDSRCVTGHIDVALELANGTLGFVDPRHLGRVRWVESPDEIPTIRSMGVEPLSPAFTPETLAALLRGSKLPLKLFLLDQKRIAGIGNIYSNEAMWRAGLKPQRRAASLSRVEVRRLHKAIVDVLERALECCLNPAPDLRDPNWWFQGIEDMLGVYGRAGEKCRACGRKVLRIEQGGRLTFWCSQCQK